MACHEVEAYLDTALVGSVNEFHHVGVGAEARINLIEVNDVVATIKPPRLEYGVQPKGVHTQRLDVVES